MGPPSSLRIPRVRRYSWSGLARSLFRLQDSHLLRSTFPRRSSTCRVSFVRPTPRAFPLTVWPLPGSLATTSGISVDFFSSPYLDVSVREVPLSALCVQTEIYGSSP